MKVKLSEPVNSPDGVLKELEFRRPKAKDLRALSTNPTMSELLDLAGQLCAQPKHVIDDLDAQDALKILEVVGGFIQGGRPTGKGL
jgi:hypothetical protein